MNKLDTVSAQALAAAREAVSRMLEPMDYFDGIAPLQPGGGRIVLRQILKRFAFWNSLNLSRLCMWARAGWDDADLALRELIAEFTERGLPMPATLSAYSLELIQPNRIPPATARGRKKATQFLQDICITVLVILLIEEHGLTPTRRQKSRPSACSVIAEALAERGIHRGGEPAINKVWERCSPMTLNGFQAKMPVVASVRN
jgi:hypothetical protein